MSVTLSCIDDSPRTDPLQQKRISAALSSLLFDDDSVGCGHEHWRRLVATEAFGHRTGLTHEERTELAYARLRLVNGSLADPEEVAADPHRLASLHEWAAVVDGALTTVAGIHYNLFLGSLLDHDPDPRRDLDPLLALSRTGTFLRTGLDHGNDAAALETVAVPVPKPTGPGTVDPGRSTNALSGTA